LIPIEKSPASKRFRAFCYPPCGYGLPFARRCCLAFTPRRTTDKMGQHRTDQNKRRHAQRHAAIRLVDLFNNQVVATLGRFAKGTICPHHGKPGDGHQVDQPRVVKPQHGRPLKAPQEKRHQRPDSHRHRHYNGHPFAKAAHLPQTKADNRMKAEIGMKTGKAAKRNSRNDSTPAQCALSRSHQLHRGSG